MATLDEMAAQIAALQATQDRILRGVALLVTHLGAAPRAAASSSASPPSQRIATDAEIDDPEYGDKTIRKDPSSKGARGWKGESYAGRRWSECPPDYLDALAGFLDWCAGKKLEDASNTPDGSDEKKKLLKYARYDEDDAAKVRAWAARNRKAAPKSEEDFA